MIFFFFPQLHLLHKAFQVDQYTRRITSLFFAVQFARDKTETKLTLSPLLTWKIAVKIMSMPITIETPLPFLLKMQSFSISILMKIFA